MAAVEVTHPSGAGVQLEERLPRVAALRMQASRIVGAPFAGQLPQF